MPRVQFNPYACVTNVDAEIDRNRYRSTLSAGGGAHALHLRPSISRRRRRRRRRCRGARITLPGCGTNRKYGDLRKRNPGKVNTEKDWKEFFEYPLDRVCHRIRRSLFVEQTGRAYFSTREANFPEDGDISSVHRRRSKRSGR